MAHPQARYNGTRKQPLATVRAGRSRRRLLILSKRGIGRKAVSEFTSLDHRTIQRIKNGRTKYVRRETQELIFSVPFNAFCNRAVIDSGPTLKLIARAQREGFTKSEIARRLSPKVRDKYKPGHASLQIALNGKVLAQTQMKVERFLNRLMEEAA